VTSLSDAAVERLRRVAQMPDLRETRYELLGPLGRGGMASVWLARDRELEREVALKVIDPADRGPAAAARMLREARVMAGLEHPGILPVHDVGVLPDGRMYYAMKRVSGRRLDEMVRDGAPLPELLRIFERICEAVAFCHARGVIHRDLKPENVMVGSFGEVLVLDWGLAKLREGPRSEAAAPGEGDPAGPGSAPAAPPPPGATGHGAVLGTPGYMAPEQARGDVEATDERADVYALGALLHYLLVGAPPGPAPDPRRERPELARPLCAICLRALAPEPGRRYGGVPALLADMVALREGGAVAAYPQGLFGRMLRGAARYRVAVALVLAYLALRIAFIFWRRS
jgi:serine/threonine-protein kinase